MIDPTRRPTEFGDILPAQISDARRRALNDSRSLAFCNSLAMLVMVAGFMCALFGRPLGFIGLMLFAMLTLAVGCYFRASEERHWALTRNLSRGEVRK